METIAAISPPVGPATSARCGDAAWLVEALRESRRDTLATLAAYEGALPAYEGALPALEVPLHPELNPPRWELGHIGWFQAHWTTRNPQLLRGWDADPLALPAAADDALYNSSVVAHDARWRLPLPSMAAIRESLAAQLELTLTLLASLPETVSRALYFHRLALLHEDMHHEAALYMARRLGIPISDPRWQAPLLPDPPPPLAMTGGLIELGGKMDDGFRFDNECGRQAQEIPPFEIDAQVLRWAEYLPFVEAGGALPRYLRRTGDGWEQWRHGAWSALDLREPACHLSAEEARAWCRWAGRRLPTEAEWVCAVREQPEALHWGAVWEWTDSRFTPFPGFQPHPYRDYSAPWFDGRPVLRGASYLTQPRMRHPDYRNFFGAARNDIAAGFRTCRA